MTPTKSLCECPFRESHFCTFGHVGSVITIEEDYNENGIIAKRASIRGRYLNQCDADDCPLNIDEDEVDPD